MLICMGLTRGFARIIRAGPRRNVAELLPDGSATEAQQKRNRQVGYGGDLWGDR